MSIHNIGKTIKTLRNKLNITQDELGKAIGVSMQAVSKWECGGTPDIDILPLIADFFDISIDELYGRNKKNGNNLNNDIYYDLTYTSDSNRFEKACSYCWSAIKGISMVKGIEHYNYNMISPDNDCTRCKILEDNGIGWMACTEDFHLACIAPEPKDGFNSIMASVSQYTHLFSILADEDCIKLLSFLYARNSSMFSIEFASEKTKIPVEKVKELIEVFMKENWITTEIVDTDNGHFTFYRPVQKESFVFFMYFAKEFISDHRFWYLSRSTRTNPILRAPIK